MALKNKTHDLDKASVARRAPLQKHAQAANAHQRPMDTVTALKLAASAQPSVLRPADILSLQRTIGNRAVQRRQVMETNSSVFGPLVSHAYQPLVERVWRVVITQTEQLARDAYFRGDTAALSRLKQSIQINEQTHPDLLVPDFMIP